MGHGINVQLSLRIVTGTVALLVIAFHATTLVVHEGQAVLVTRFGEPKRAELQAGLHWKLPWPIDQATWLDMRRQVLEGGHTEMLTRDKKNVIVRTFVVWRISDVLTFIQAIGAAERAEGKLNGLLTNAAISTLGRHDLSSLVSTNLADLQFDQIESELFLETAALARENYGIKIEQIRIERIALPEENITAVFEQMRAERNQFAAKFRAEGEEEASRIRSEAELEAARIHANATEQTARIRGDAQAEAAKTYAAAHSVNPEFYRFTRSLESLGKLVTPNTTLVLRTDAEPFSMLLGDQKK